MTTTGSNADTSGLRPRDELDERIQALFGDDGRPGRDDPDAEPQAAPLQAPRHPSARTVAVVALLCGAAVAAMLLLPV